APAARADEPRVVPDLAPDLALDAGTTAAPERVRIEPVAPVAPQPVTTRSATATGRVLALAGAPVGGIAIALRAQPTEVIATSAPDGSFPIADARAELVVADPSWYTLRDTEPMLRPNG